MTDFDQMRIENKRLQNDLDCARRSIEFITRERDDLQNANKELMTELAKVRESKEIVK